MNKRIIFLLSIATFILSSCNKGDEQKLLGTWQTNASADGLSSGVTTQWVFSNSSKGSFQVAINEQSMMVKNTNPIEWKIEDIEGKKYIIVQYGKAEVESSDDYMKQILEEQDLKLNTTDTVLYSFQDDKTLVIKHLSIKPTIKDTAKVTFTKQ